MNMISLIKLEKMKINLKPYWYSVGYITFSIMLIMLIILFSSKFSLTADVELKKFMNYSDLINLTLLLSLSCFSILSTVMFSKIIIEEYVSKKSVLMFTYPVNRKKLLDSKLLYSIGFTSFCMILSNFLIFFVLFIFNNFIGFIEKPISKNILFHLAITILLATIISIGISMFSLLIGFNKKSTVTSIITNIIIIALVSNSLMFDIAILISSIVALLLSNYVIFSLKRKISDIEV